MIEKQEVQEIFPTPLWIVDLQPAAAAALNARLKAEIERLIAPRPKIPAGSNWQTPQDLHTKPAFAEFVKLVETAARGVARSLQIDQYPMGITGCWANVNPPGAYHPMHYHPNNYLSGVYYVAVPTAGSQIIFQDPRGQASMIMPKPRQYTRLTANGANAQSRAGRLLIFPAWLKHTVPANDGGTDGGADASEVSDTSYARANGKPPTSREDVPVFDRGGREDLPRDRPRRPAQGASPRPPRSSPPSAASASRSGRGAHRSGCPSYIQPCRLWLYAAGRLPGLRRTG